MKRFIRFIPLFGILSLALPACKPTLDEVQPNNGDLDFSKYVAYGDYITAGYMNGAVTKESQQTAYPAILAHQFARAGGKQSFNQPYFEGLEGQPEISITGYHADGTPILSPSEALEKIILPNCQSDPYPNFQPYSAMAATELQNLGIPGLRIRQLSKTGVGDVANNMVPYGNPPKFNPYLGRLLPSGDTRTYIQVAAAAKPTFFTAWFGMSDMVAFILSGVNGGNSCGALSLPTSGQFTTEITALLDSLTAKGTRRGAICNLPTIDDLPLTRTLALNTQQVLSSLGAQEAAWVVPNNGVVRKLESNDLVLFKALPKFKRRDPVLDLVTVKGGVQQVEPYGMSEYNPFVTTDVLDASEAGILRDRIGQNFNETLNTLVRDESGKFNKVVALVDMKGLFASMRQGLIYNGVKYSNTPITGGFFSLDNFTITPRGQAIIANKIIQTMNEKFGSRIPEVNVSDYPLIRTPQ